MATSPALSHIVVWKDTRDGIDAGGDTRNGWAIYVRCSEGDRYFLQEGPQAVSAAAGLALHRAITLRRNVTVAWGDAVPNSVPSNKIEQVLLELRPIYIICPERSPSPFDTDNAWVSIFLSEGRHLQRWREPDSRWPAERMQQGIGESCQNWFPIWKHREYWRPAGLVLRHDISGEEMGFIRPLEITPDSVLNRTMDDPAVRRALMLRDPARRSTYVDFIRVVLAAQPALGIPEQDQVPMYSGEVAAYFGPIASRLGPYEDRARAVRKQLRYDFGEFDQFVLRFMLKTYSPYGAISEGLRRALLEPKKAAA